MNNYEVALKGIQGLIKSTKTPLNSFDRKNYHAAFERIYSETVPSFDALQALYVSVAEPETMLDNMAAALTEAAASELEECKKRSQKEIMMMNLNMQLAVFIYPAILHYKGDFSGPFIELIQKRWKAQFPKSNVTPADLETIEKGFHRKFCYITTAVCRTFGKADDCYELNAFRTYRDSYLLKQPDGPEMVSRYYDIAPTIVKHIGMRNDAQQIYENIWKDYLDPCLQMIENNENEACAALYTEMVETMKHRYFFTR